MRLAGRFCHLKTRRPAASPMAAEMVQSGRDPAAVIRPPSGCHAVLGAAAGAPPLPAGGRAAASRPHFSSSGPCRFQMAETTCQPQFEDPHHLEWLIRRLSASSIWARLPFFGERAVRPWRRVLWFRRAPPGPVSRAFARGWVGSRYRAEKGSGPWPQGGIPRNPLRAGWLASLPLVGRGDFPQPQKCARTPEPFARPIFSLKVRDAKASGTGT